MSIECKSRLGSIASDCCLPLERLCDYVRIIKMTKNRMNNCKINYSAAAQEAHELLSKGLRIKCCAKLFSQAVLDFTIGITLKQCSKKFNAKSKFIEHFFLLIKTTFQCQ